MSNKGMIFKYHPYDQTSFISNQGMISKYHPYDQISYIHIKTRHDIQIVKYHPYYQWFCSESSSHSKSPLVELQKKDYHTLVNLLVGGPSQFDKTHIFIMFGSQDLVSIACEIWA